MTWQPIDFQRIVALDRTLVDQLKKYLQEKEADLGNALLYSVPQVTSATPVIPPARTLSLKISDAVEGFGKKLRQVTADSNDSLSPDTWKEVAQSINAAFWDYEEVLEGCVKELFQQLDQIGIEQWNTELSLVLDSIKEMLLHAIEDFVWVLRRVESQIAEFRLAQDAQQGKWVFIRQIINYWRPVIDRSLSGNLIQTEKYLKIHHKQYAHRLAEYISLDEKVRYIMKKLNGYQVLNSLDENLKTKFETIYYYVKLWGSNQKSKAVPVQDMIRALSYAVSVEQTIDLFGKYTQALKAALFHQSRVLKKKNLRYLKEASGKKMIREVMKGYRAELLTLGSTVAKYREFLLRTDPNPYVRSRWGFTEWVVGPEPEQTKQLLNIEYEVENLENLFERIQESIEKGPKKNAPKLVRLSSDIQRVLHEMGQPLTSYNMTKTRAEYVVEHLQELDELGSFDHNTIEYASNLFSKVLRADWKHHVLHELPLFHDLFNIHMGLVGPSSDRNHQNRMNKFRHLIQEIESWVKNREIRRHEHDIELDMNDLKGYLQDFLAQVQRTAKDDKVNSDNAKRVISELSHQLLVYRYLFGEFFHFLGRFTPDGKRIRNKLLFVDQYFESVENKLHVLRNMSWPAP
ncbi:MAG: hypothetical protein VX777_00035 [Chlamydiota bacterium]|nr:hypothetical protein [Chlamydiota bacterium]